MQYSYLACCLTLASIVSAQDVPTGEIKKEDLRAHLAAVRRAWRELDRPAQSLTSILFSDDAGELQGKVDPDVGIVVTINPEARVKVQRGPAAIELDYGWPTPVLVKVLNEGGLTAELNVHTVAQTGITARFFECTSLNDQSTLTRKLTGRGVEYQILLLRSTVHGRQEIKLTFDVGQGTQDLGQRSELPILADTAQRDRTFYPDRMDLLSYSERDGKRIPVQGESDWYQRRFEIEKNFKAVAGHIRVDPTPSGELDVQVLNEVILDKVIRRSITYKTADDDRVPAYVFLPRVRRGKLPAVLCLHQTTKLGKAEPAGLGGLKNLHYALELAERGYITLAPDYPGYGDYTQCNPYLITHGRFQKDRGPARHVPLDVVQGGHFKGDPYASATAKGIANHQTAVDVLTSLPEVDSNRIGCLGHSLGGHNTLFVSLFDDRIKVLATSCGFCSFPKYMGGNLAGWSHKGYMPRIASVYQNDPKQMPFDFTEILAAMAPRPVFINAPLQDANFAVDGVRDCVKAARPVYQLLGKPEHLIVEHPDCGHDFPPDVRERCYQFFDRFLRDRAASK